LIIGISQDPSTQEYYLVFYHEIRLVLDKIMHHFSFENGRRMQYDDFYELREIGSSSYRTVYAAKYKNHSLRIPEILVLKRFKNFDQTKELFISEVSLYILIYISTNMIFNLTLYLFIYLFT